MTKLVDKEKLTELLKENVALITFEKVDKSIREMRCSLKPEYLPENYEDSKVETKDDDTTSFLDRDGVVSVWDLEVGGWRSFRINSIKKVLVE